jgi:glutamate/aspartate transport system substrate-binding protein
MLPACVSKVIGCCAAALALTLALPAAAQNTAQEAAQADPGRLSGTLKKIKESGVVRIGYRASSAPFSYLDEQGRPVGYSLDLCMALVQDIVDELGGIELRTELRPVTPQNRFALVVAGDIDIECGSTTNNAERRQQVAFSPAIFITGTKLLARRDGPVRSVLDLKARPVAVTRDTTNAAAMRVLSQRHALALALVESADHHESLALLASGKVDAFASDEVLLYGLIAESRSKHWRVVGDFLSYESYGLVFRRGDPAFAAVVERGFRRLAASREIVWIYDKWFLQRLPSGLRLGLPMSPQLQETFRILGLPA